jgi:hypothetical protein
MTTPDPTLEQIYANDPVILRLKALCTHQEAAKHRRMEELGKELDALNLELGKLKEERNTVSLKIFAKCTAINRKKRTRIKLNWTAANPRIARRINTRKLMLRRREEKRQVAEAGRLRAIEFRRKLNIPLTGLMPKT